MIQSEKSPAHCDAQKDITSIKATHRFCNPALASRPVRFVLCDEIDRYPISAKDEGDPVLLAKKRTTTFWNWLLMCVSTPTVKGISRIEKFWEKSDKRRYFVNCPHCDHPQHFVWERLQYVGKGTEGADPHSGVYYICEKCDRLIEEKEKPAMVKNGKWQATAVSQDGTVGFHLNEMYSLWRRWLDVALDYESARTDEAQLRVWHNTSLGLPYDTKSCCQNQLIDYPLKPSFR